MEAADLDKLNQVRQDSQAEMDKNLAETNSTLETIREEVHRPCHSSTLPAQLLLAALALIQQLYTQHRRFGPLCE